MQRARVPVRFTLQVENLFCANPPNFIKLHQALSHYLGRVEVGIYLASLLPSFPLPTRITFSLLIINPNSARSITDGLAEALNPMAIGSEVSLTFYAAPPSAPPSINDYTTACLTAVHCFEALRRTEMLDAYDGFMICCC